nr:MAG TPA: hypothetical protein [Caudoviricetes sp.]
MECGIIFIEKEFHDVKIITFRDCTISTRQDSSDRRTWDYFYRKGVS